MISVELFFYYLSSSNHCLFSKNIFVICKNEKTSLKVNSVLEREPSQTILTLKLSILIYFSMKSYQNYAKLSKQCKGIKTRRIQFIFTKSEKYLRNKLIYFSRFWKTCYYTDVFLISTRNTFPFSTSFDTIFEIIKKRTHCRSHSRFNLVTKFQF